MRYTFIAISAIFGAFAAATSETIQITDFSLRTIDSTIQAASFDISPDNVYCAGDDSAKFDSTISCNTTGWSFYVSGSGLSSYNLIVYKETGDFSGIYGQAPVSVVCHAGGSSATDYVCNGATTDITLQ